MKKKLSSYSTHENSVNSILPTHLELDKERVKFRDFIKLIKNENERE